jgi:hypothetical protein
MSKYLYLYRGPATRMEDFTPEQGEAQMKAWNTWIEGAKSALVDVGNPLAPRASVRDDGTEAEPSDQNGYSIVEADSLEQARELLRGPPVPVRRQGPVRGRGLRDRADVAQTSVKS